MKVLFHRITPGPMATSLFPYGCKSAITTPHLCNKEPTLAALCHKVPTTMESEIQRVHGSMNEIDREAIIKRARGSIIGGSAPVTLTTSVQIATDFRVFYSVSTLMSSHMRP